MNSPLISIIIASYNASKYLDECLQSVLEQTYINWEAIIVNDGSTDNTKQVVKKWIKQDSRFKYYEKPNTGLAQTRIFGIKNSSGKYILPLDADDYLDINFLAKTSKVIEENKDIEIVYSDVKLFGEKNKLFVLPKYSFNSLLLKNCIISTSLFRRESYNNVGGYCSELTSLEDWDLWISILKNGGKTYKINEVLFYYRTHNSGSLTNKLFKNPAKYIEYHNIIFKRHSDVFIKHVGNPILIKRELDRLKEEKDKPIKLKLISFLKKIYAKILKK